MQTFGGFGQGIILSNATVNIQNWLTLYYGLNIRI